jgi:hypothetical protein
MSAATLFTDVCLRSFELLEHIQARQCVYGSLLYLVEDIKGPPICKYLEYMAD